MEKNLPLFLFDINRIESTFIPQTRSTNRKTEYNVEIIFFIARFMLVESWFSLESNNLQL